MGHMTSWVSTAYYPTGPLIRRESVYTNDLMEDRKRLFNALFNFTRKLDFRYICAKIRKDEFQDVITLTARISKAIAEILRSHQDFLENLTRL